MGSGFSVEGGFLAETNIRVCNESKGDQDTACCLGEHGLVCSSAFLVGKGFTDAEVLKLVYLLPVLLS